MFRWLCECMVQWWYKPGACVKTSSETLSFSSHALSRSLCTHKLGNLGIMPSTLKPENLYNNELCDHEFIECTFSPIELRRF